MSTIIAFIVLFGVLVFVHELGHFLMAKFFKVGVEKFSLGFGPKLFGKKVGETEYLISILPLGGFVKMVGDEPIDETQAEESGKKMPENGFLAKPPWQRMLIVIMGPIANLILPIALFTIIYMVGHPYLSSYVGYVRPDSPAAKVGLQQGDQIVAVDGEAVKEWRNMTKLIEKKAAKDVTLAIKRDGKDMDIRVTPELGDSLNPFGQTVKVGKIGVGPQSFLPYLHVPTENSAAYLAGVRSGDLLTTIDNKPASFLSELERALSQAKGPVEISVKRGEATEKITLRPQEFTSANAQASLTAGGIYHQQLVVDKILPGSIAEEKGLKSNDLLIAINEKPLGDWFTFQDMVRANQGEALNVTIIREGKQMSLDLNPKLVEQREEYTGEKFKQRMLGVTTKGEIQTRVLTERILNPFKAFSVSFTKCYEISRLTVIGFGMLITGQVSPKAVGGPILIAQLAGKSWRSGFYAFLNMLVLISITLGVLNLLPIPVLDGGHLVFYGIEMIQGRPVRARTRELAQQVGVLLLIGLMVFALYNDLGRISWGELEWVKRLKDVFS